MNAPTVADTTDLVVAVSCPHTPLCPPADAVDHAAARAVAHDEITGYTLLCNGVIMFSDTGELQPRPDTAAGSQLPTPVPPQRGPAPHNYAATS